MFTGGINPMFEKGAYQLFKRGINPTFKRGGGGGNPMF